MGRDGDLRPLVDLDPVPELFVPTGAQTIRVLAPVTACEGETPTFRAELFDADNMPVEVEGLLTVDGGLVSVEVPYTPKNAGLHFLRVSFEPNLGARSVSLLVAGMADVTRGVVVKLPPAACASPWPLGGDAVACEASGEVMVVFADGGVERFAGAQVATSGAAVWSVDPSRTVLERRVLDGGVFDITTWRDITTMPLAGEHGEAFAFRRGFGLDLKLASMNAIARPQVELISNEALPPPTFYVRSEWNFEGFGAAGCLSPGLNCRVRTAPLAAERGVVWTFDEEFAPGFLRATPLSVTLMAPNPLPTLLSRHSIEAGRFEGPFELVPLWAGPVLISMRGGTVSATVWPRERVLRVASNFVVVQEPDALSVRLVPR